MSEGQRNNAAARPAAVESADAQQAVLPIQQRHNSNQCYKLLDLKLKLLLPKMLLSWLCKEIPAILILLTRRWNCCRFVSLNLRIIIFGGSCDIVLCRSEFLFIPVFFAVRWVGLSPLRRGVIFRLTVMILVHWNSLPYVFRDFSRLVICFPCPLG